MKILCFQNFLFCILTTRYLNPKKIYVVDLGGNAILELTKYTLIEGFDQLCAFGTSMLYGTIGALMVLIFSRLILWSAEFLQLQNDLWTTIITGIASLASCIMFVIFCIIGILSLLIKTYVHSKQQLKETILTEKIESQHVVLNEPIQSGE
jgi:hypothetical protein